MNNKRKYIRDILEGGEYIHLSGCNPPFFWHFAHLSFGDKAYGERNILVMYSILLAPRIYIFYTNNSISMPSVRISYDYPSIRIALLQKQVEFDQKNPPKEELDRLI